MFFIVQRSVIRSYTVYVLNWAGRVLMCYDVCKCEKAIGENPLDSCEGKALCDKIIFPATNAHLLHSWVYDMSYKKQLYLWENSVWYEL